MLTDLLFDSPWWLPTGTIGIGLVILFMGTRQGDKRLTRVGLALALLGISIGTISYLVETDLEKAVNRTYCMAKAVNDRDWTTFASLLDPQTTLYDLDHDAIVEQAKEKVDTLGLNNVRITGHEARKNGPIILVSIRVLAEFRGFGPMPTDWQLQWQDFGKGMVLYTIRALPNESTSEEQIREHLNHR